MIANLLNPYRYAAAVGAYATAVLADSPLAYWRLGEPSGTSMVDASGNGRNGTYAGSPTLGAAGMTTDGDTAVTFNGTSQYATVVSGAWVPTHLVSWSAECWVKFTTTSFAVILSVRIAGGANKAVTVNLLVGRTAGRIGAETWDWENAGSRALATGTSNDGLKHHVVVTFDKPTNTLKLYVDGALHDTKAQGVTGTGSDRSVTIAANNAGVLQWFPGTVDEVALYGTVLDATRVAAHYAAA